MKLNLYAIKDVKVGFDRPFVEHNDATASRMFQDAVQNKQLRYADDMELWKFGEYDNISGEIKGQLKFIYKEANKDA